MELQYPCHLHSNFAPGDASASISIAIDDDELYEGGASGTPEDIKFELSSLVNASEGAHHMTITLTITRIRSNLI